LIVQGEGWLVFLLIKIKRSRFGSKERSYDMEHILVKTGFVALSILVAFFFSVPQVDAETFKVKCDKGGTIQKVIDRVKPTDVIEVSGTCNERVEIGEQVQNITLDGQGTATIISADPNRSTFFVRGTGITITGFTITGGSNGINVNRGGTARIVFNTIENNENGIAVSEGGTARIGFLSAFDTVASPNVIQSNVSFGIGLRRDSSARIVGNTIRNNRDGIDVGRGSQADISFNLINDNVRDGIRVSENSGGELGTDSANPETIFTLPNSTTVGSENGRFGLQCFRNSYVDGRVGTLNGDTNDRNTSGCDDSLAD
jgi:parallel beta-helix repeat protein